MTPNTAQSISHAESRLVRLLRRLFGSFLSAGALSLILPGAMGGESVDLAPLPLPTLLTPGDLASCVVAGHLCFASAGEAGLLVIDVSDASHPRQVGQCQTGGGAKVVVVSGHTAYVGDDIGGFQIIDVSLPENPRVLGAEGSIKGISSVAIADGFAYVVNGDLSVVDVRNPMEPRKLGSYSIPMEGEDVPLYSLSTIALAGHYALCGVGPSLWTFDLADPVHPRLAGRHPMDDGEITGLVIRGNQAFLSLNWNGLGALDIKDPLQPSTIGNWSVPGSATSVHLVGSKVAVATSYPSLCLFDFGSSSNPRLAGVLPLSSGVNAVDGTGHYAFVAAGTNGLQSLDLIPANPPSGASRTAGFSRSLAVRGLIALVGRIGTNSLAGSIGVVDLSRPDHPKEVATFNSGLGIPTRIAIASDWACYLNFAGDIGEGGSFRTITLSDPTQPRSLGSLDLGYDAADVLLSGSTAFVAHRLKGLIAVDVSDPARPQTLATLGLDGEAQAIAVADDWACLASGPAGLHVVDIHDPARPVRIGGLSTAGDATAVAMSGRLCAIGGTGGQISLIDIREPQSPKILGHYPYLGSLRSIAISNDVLVMSAYPGGIEVVDVHDPTLPRRLSGNSSVEPEDLIFDGDRIHIAGYGSEGISTLGPIRRVLWDFPGSREEGPADLRVYGLPGERFHVESSPDLETWQRVGALEMGDRPTLVTGPLPPGDAGQTLVRARPIP